MVGLLSLSETKELQGEDLVTYLKIRYTYCVQEGKRTYTMRCPMGGLLYVQKFSFEESHAATRIILLLTKKLSLA